MKIPEVGDKVKVKLWRTGFPIQCITTTIVETRDSHRESVRVLWEGGSKHTDGWWVYGNVKGACRQQPTGYVVENYGQDK